MIPSKGFAAPIALVFGLLVLASPQAAAEGFVSGLQLCAASVLPALYPFFVICELVSGSFLAERLAGILTPLTRALGFHSRPAPLILLLSFLGGYAVCARCIRQAGQELSERDAVLLLILGCCSGPGFVVGCVGGLLLNSVPLGILLYILQIAANFFVAALAALFLPHSREPDVRGSGRCTPVSLAAAISHAVDSSLIVCGCVVFFRTVYTVLSHHLSAGPLLSGLLEISAGCADYAALGGRGALYGCCFCLSVLGFSVWTQLSALLQGSVSLKPLFVSRLLHTLIYPALVWIFVRILPGSTAVYSSLSERVIITNRMAPDALLFALLFLGTALYKIIQNFYNDSIRLYK